MQSTPPKSSVENSPTKTEVTPQLRFVLWLAVIITGLLQFWAHRNAMNPDGISYIEMAEASIRTGWHGLVNGYWSPLYPFLISIGLRIFHPRPQWQFTVVHGLNFVLYLASFACFEIFLKQLLLSKRTADSPGPDSTRCVPRTQWTWSCVLFLWSSHYWLTLRDVVPDLCVAALVYLATALLLRIWMGRAGWLDFVLFGAVLGIAYLAKAAMFPLVFVFLASAFILLVKRRVSLARIVAMKLATVVIFAAISAPLIFALSHAKGRLTFGDSGKIAYAEYVDKVTLNVHWQGEPGNAGTPLHPTRKMLSNPPLYEFAQPVSGSYPPWYDPSYWYDGVQPHFSLKGQLWVLFRAANTYLKMFSKSGVLYLIALTFLFLLKTGGLWSPAPKGLWFVLFPSIAALLMYSLVLVEFRYVAPFAMVLLVSTFSHQRIPQSAETPYQKCATAVIFIAPLLAILWPVSSEIAAIVKPKPFEQWEVARGLHDLGAPSGTQVGFIGRGNQAYWAHLAGMRIIAEIPEQSEFAFLQSGAQKQAQVLDKFEQLGASVVVIRLSERDVPMAAWQQIAGTRYFAYPLGDGRMNR